MSDAANARTARDPRDAAKQLADALLRDPEHRRWVRETTIAFREGKITDAPDTVEEIDRLAKS